MKSWQLGVAGLALGVAAGGAGAVLLLHPPWARPAPQDQPGTASAVSPPAAKPTPAAETRGKEPAPFLRITRARRHSFPDALGRTWHLEGYRVKELTVRMFVMRAGKAQLVAETVCEWDEWQWEGFPGEEHYRTTGELVYWLQDDEMPRLSLDLSQEPEYSEPYKRSKCERVRVDLGGGLWWLPDTKAAPGKETILYAGAVTPPSVKREGDRTVIRGHFRAPREVTKEGLVELSKEGSTGLAVTLTWQPQ
jgi:hypothetical protein